MCALEQDKFWNYHDILYANQGAAENAGAFSDKRLQVFAESLGLDMTAFNKCFNADKYKADIQAELQQGKDAGVTGTPTIFINGKLFSGGYVPYSQIQSGIEAALASGG
jgi:protein-disulfide isomerase